MVDGTDSFDPRSAEAAGVALDRVLWVRAPGLREALRTASLDNDLRTAQVALERQRARKMRLDNDAQERRQRQQEEADAQAQVVGASYVCVRNVGRSE